MNAQKMYYLHYNASPLAINNVGEQHCAPNHYNGPKSRDHFIFHFVVEGEGRFEIHGKKYELKKNQGFLIPDSSVIFYQADALNPWYYCWFQISGSEAENIFSRLSLSSKNPIYNAKPENSIHDKFKKLICCANQSQPDRNMIVSYMYALFSELELSNINESPTTVSDSALYAQKAESYILDNYHLEDFRISDIADYVGLNRSYLSRLFHSYFELSPQQYLFRHRMVKAKKLLSENVPVNIVASSVGYGDVPTFSKAYKKYFGAAPSKSKS